MPLLPAPQSRDVNPPIPEFGNILMLLRQRARIEDAVRDATIREPDRTAIEMRWLSRFDAPPYRAAHAIDLAGDRDAARRHLEHAGMDVADRMETIPGRGAERAQEGCTVQVVMQRKAPHQRSVHKEFDSHRFNRVPSAAYD